MSGLWFLVSIATAPHRNLVSRRSLAAGLFAPCLAATRPSAYRPAAAADAADATAPPPELQADGFALRVPRAFYRPVGGRGRTGLYDDLVLVAADYPSGRTLSVSRTDARTLLVDSGDTIALETGPLKQLRELGKPSKIASLLVSRRAGDPQGLNARRTEVVSAVQSANELRFVVREPVAVATSMTTAQPTSRVVQARSIFVPPDGGRGAYLLTAWASSSIRVDLARCTPQPCECGEGASLSCDCPNPICEEVSDGADVATLGYSDADMVDSLRLTG